MGTYYLRVLAGQFQQCLAKYVLETWRGVCRVLHQSLTSLCIKLARSVPYSHVFFGRGIAVAFLGMQVQQLGAFHVF